MKVRSSRLSSGRAWGKRLEGTLARPGVILVAARVTFYLALFPAIAALVALYGLFADPTTITSHLDSIADLRSQTFPNEFLRERRVPKNSTCYDF